MDALLSLAFSPSHFATFILFRLTAISKQLQKFSLAILLISLHVWVVFETLKHFGLFLFLCIQNIIVTDVIRSVCVSV